MHLNYDFLNHYTTPLLNTEPECYKWRQQLMFKGGNLTSCWNLTFCWKTFWLVERAWGNVKTWSFCCTFGCCFKVSCTEPQKQALYSCLWSKCHKIPMNFWICSIKNIYIFGNNPTNTSLTTSLVSSLIFTMTNLFS